MDLCCPYRAGAAVPQSQSVRRVGDRDRKFSEQVAVLEVIFKLPEEFEAEWSPNSCPLLQNQGETFHPVRLPFSCCSVPALTLLVFVFNPFPA